MRHHPHARPEPHDALYRRLVHQGAVVAHLHERSYNRVVPGLEVIADPRVTVDYRSPSDHAVLAQHGGPALFVVPKSDVHARLNEGALTYLSVYEIVCVYGIHPVLRLPTQVVAEGYHAGLPLLTASYPIATLDR